MYYLPRWNGNGILDYVKVIVSVNRSGYETENLVKVEHVASKIVIQSKETGTAF